MGPRPQKPTPRLYKYGYDACRRLDLADSHLSQYFVFPLSLPAVTCPCLVFGRTNDSFRMYRYFRSKVRLPPKQICRSVPSHFNPNPSQIPIVPIAIPIVVIRNRSLLNWAPRNLLPRLYFWNQWLLNYSENLLVTRTLCHLKLNLPI